MKRYICTALFLAAASAITACGKKTGSDSGVLSAVSGTEEYVEEVTEIESYVPLATVRDRNIVKADNFDYEIYEDRVIITKYNGTETDVVIPDEIEGQAVTEIGFYAFEAKYDLQSVTLPETVTAIRECAFMDCSSLYAINIPSGLKEIERGAFVACTSLTDMTIPAGVTQIQEEAFTACEGMTSLTILNPDLQYESWGLEELPELTVYAEEGTAVADWASAMGKFAPLS